MNFFEHLTDMYGGDVAEQIAADLATELDDMVRGVAGVEFDGVWEEGYRDAIYDLAKRLTAEQDPDAGGALSRLVPPCTHPVDVPHHDHCAVPA